MTIDVLVSETDFLNTYPNGVRDAQDYASAIALKIQDESLSAAEIARRINRLPQTVYWWFKKNDESERKSKPRCLNGLERAKSARIIPFSADSEKFLAISRLAAWVFWDGKISASYITNIANSSLAIAALQEYFVSLLGLECRLSRVYKDRLHLQLCQEQSAIYGRLLRCLGLPVEPFKTSGELHIPAIARATPQTQREFLHVLFATRNQGDCSLSWTLMLRGNDSYEHSCAFGMEALAFLNEAVPGLALQEKNIDFEPVMLVHGKNKPQHVVYPPRIYLNKAALSCIASKFPEILLADSAGAHVQAIPYIGVNAEVTQFVEF